MVVAGERWLGVRLDLLTLLLDGAVAVAAVLVSQDTGRYKEKKLQQGGVALFCCTYVLCISR